ncbi:MAG: hypothetical protein OHK0039_33280 [Bacteroidia bacterium]
MLQLVYPGKADPETLRAQIPACDLRLVAGDGTGDLLVEGDNLPVLKHLLDVRGLAGQVDLVYIDPPFATEQVFTMSEGRGSTISRSGGEVAYSDTLTGPAYLEMLRARLYLLRALLSDQGTIYLHIDYKVGHYVKVLMDEVFGAEQFRNDIARIKCNPKNFARRAYGNVKDLILVYTKTDQYIWHEPYEPYSEADLERLYPRTDARGRRYTTIPLHAPGETRDGATSRPFRGIRPPQGRHWRSAVEVLEAWDQAGLIAWSSKGNPRKIIYADEQPGKRLQDVWTFKDPTYPVYPTEKPAALLDRIVATSSGPGSLVLDCFCGSGTTLLAARRQGRRFIGIDRSAAALAQTRRKLEAAASPNPDHTSTYLTCLAE